MRSPLSILVVAATFASLPVFESVAADAVTAYPDAEYVVLGTGATCVPKDVRVDGESVVTLVVTGFYGNIQGEPRAHAVLRFAFTGNAGASCWLPLGEALWHVTFLGNGTGQGLG